MFFFFGTYTILLTQKSTFKRYNVIYVIKIVHLKAISIIYESYMFEERYVLRLLYDNELGNAGEGDKRKKSGR